MLSPYRVLDLSDERGQLCGQILGDLGADVILIEPPGGSSARRIAPFVNDAGDAPDSLHFWGLNRNKRSVVLDLDSATGRADLRTLAADADILIESFPPGHLDSLGLGVAALRSLNPGLIVVSITAFGQQGPKAHWAANDLTVLAASGVLQITGDGDRPPTRLVVPQAFLHGAAEAAVGALVALHARERDGLGQHVDASAQAATMLATQFFVLSHAWGVAQLERVAGGMKVGPIVLKFVNPARDGHVSVTFFFGTSGGPFARRLMEVMHERGFVDAATRDEDWLNYTDLLMTGVEPATELMRCIDAIATFTAQYTKAELFALARQRDLLIVPVATTAEVADSEQLAAREYWVEMVHEAPARHVRYPGPFARFSATPLRYRHAPPRAGQHQDEVLAEGATRARSTPRKPVTGAPRAPALAGVKILDFMWVIAGPASTRTLADYGATVVHIESTRAVDAARTVQPFWQNQAGAERSSAYANVGAGKYGCVLNLRSPQARAVLQRLVQWADVVTDSFACGVMQRLELDYAHLRAWNPSIIALSSCLNGQSGPHATLAGFGTMGAQMAGFGELAGWPDRAPAGPFGAYTDYVAPKFTAAALLAALDHRRRTGEGQHIDLSQSEAALHFIAPAMLDYTVNGHVMKRTGNASPESCPHGVYAAAGVDRWVAIAADSDVQWQALVRVIGCDGRLAGLTTLAARHRAAPEIDAAINAWTAVRTADEIENALQAVAVPVHRSSLSADLNDDAQLAARRHFVTVPHAALGPIPIEHSRLRLSDTPATVTRPGPVYGEDNTHVLRDLLGYEDEEITALHAAGVLE